MLSASGHTHFAADQIAAVVVVEIFCSQGKATLLSLWKVVWNMTTSIQEKILDVPGAVKKTGGSSFVDQTIGPCYGSVMKNFSIKFSF